MAKFAVILPAAGKSSRFSGPTQRKKPFVELKGRAVWLRAAEHFVNREDVIQTLLVISPDDVDWFKDRFRANMAFLNIEIVNGGETRAESVLLALQHVKEEADFVAVHDAARPLLVAEWVDAVFAAAEKSGAAIPAVPVSSTLKRVVDENVISETVSREGLWAAQTPQVFRRQLLIDAYNQATVDVATDEAQVVEQFGHPVSIIPGWPMNFKITTADDFTMAQAVLDSLPKKSLRSLHPFADERPGFLQD